MQRGIGHEQLPEHRLTKAILDDPTAPGAAKMARIRGQERDLAAM
jgi:hypothetical protein